MCGKPFPSVELVCGRETRLRPQSRSFSIKFRPGSIVALFGASITLFRLGHSPLGGQQGNVPGSPGRRLATRAGGTCVGAPSLLSTLSKGPLEGSACSRCRHRGDRGGNFPYNCMRESHPPWPHKGIRTLDSKHFEIVKYLESKTGYEILTYHKAGILQRVRRALLLSHLR